MQLRIYKIIVHLNEPICVCMYVYILIHYSNMFTFLIILILTLFMSHIFFNYMHKPEKGSKFVLNN